MNRLLSPCSVASRFLSKHLVWLMTILLLMAISSQTQAAGLRIRGEVSAIDSHKQQQLMTIKTSSGQKIEVIMAPEYSVLLYRSIDFGAIPANAYLSIPSVPGPNNLRRALGINVFPEAMRGFHEGIGDWDLAANSKMTNATLAQAVKQTTGTKRTLTVKFGQEQQEILVPLATPITTFGPSQDHQINLGDKVVVFAAVEAGTITGQFVGVHENGQLPPI